MSTQWKLLAQPSKGGHRFFEDSATGRIAIADHSGDLPDETEDGEIWMDGAKMATIRRHGELYSAPRVRFANSDEVIVSFADLVWIIERRLLGARDVLVVTDRSADVPASNEALSRLLSLVNAR